MSMNMLLLNEPYCTSSFLCNFSINWKDFFFFFSNQQFSWNSFMCNSLPLCYDEWIQQWSYLCCSWAVSITGRINSSVLQGWSMKKGWPSRGCSYHTHMYMHVHTHPHTTLSKACRMMMVIIKQRAASLLLVPAYWLYSVDCSEVWAWSLDEQSSTPPLMTGSSPLAR